MTVAAGRAHDLGGARHEAVGHVGQSLVGEDRTDDQRGEAHTIVFEAADRAAQALEIGLAELGFARAGTSGRSFSGKGMARTSPALF
jgi:hypothetical protein